MNNGLEFFHPQTEDEWNNIATDVEFLSGAGAVGCVFTGTWKNKKHIFKALFAHPDDIETDLVLFNDKSVKLFVKRELYIGSLLSKLPSGISDMFGCARGLVVSDTLPATWKTKMTKNKSAKECVLRQKDAIKVYVIIQDFMEGVPLDTFVSNSSIKFSGEVIRSFIFQMVLALGVAQHEIGFVHNDLKLENVMALPVADEEILNYSINGDRFTLKIPKGGFKIGIIDFGASVLVTSENIDEWPEFRSGTNTHTPLYEPFDMITMLEDRKNDSDMAAIFTMAVNMIAHMRKAIPIDYGYTEKERIYRHETGVGFFSNYDDTYGENIAKELLETLYAKKVLGTLSKDDYAIYMEHSNRWGLSVLMGIAMDMNFENNQDIPVEMGGGYRNVYINMSNPQGKFQAILRKKKLKAYFSMVPEMIKDAFPDDGEMAQKFFVRLFDPWAKNRLAFGVEAFPTHAFSNALYHPFLAGVLWDMNANDSNSITIDRPIVFRQGDLKNIVLSWNSIEKQIDNALSKKQIVKDTKSDSEATSTEKKTEKSVVKFYSEGNVIQKTKADTGSFMMAIIDEMLTMYYSPDSTFQKNITYEQLSNMIQHQFLPLYESSLKLNTTEQTFIRSKFFGSSDKITLTTAFTNSKNKSRVIFFKVAKATGFDVQNLSFDFDDVEDVFAAVSESMFVYFGIAQKLKNAKAGIFNAIQETLENFDKLFPEGDASAVFTSTRAQFDKWKKITDYVNMQIIGQTLSKIENNLRYCPSAYEFALNLVKDDLIVPVYSEMTTHPDLSTALNYFESNLRKTPLESMTRSNQIDFFHKLGIIAEMMHTEDFSSEKISQCLENQIINI